jgi:hypothetical protein
MITYNDAEARYNKTKKPPRSKKYNEFQRPLRRVTESGLMLQKDNHSYAYIINGNEVGRFCEPNDLGEAEVLVRGLYATFDIQQMYKYTGLHSGRRSRLQQAIECKCHTIRSTRYNTKITQQS